ncbi:MULTISPECIES: DUF4442 domain-containing protein [Kocuria]|nr:MULTISPECIES: DUF4442 domain-containing protein [Kocuria]
MARSSATQQSVGPVKRALKSPKALAMGMSLWPPFLGAGVQVREIAPDWRRVRVTIRARPWTSNYVGTVFGGTMLSATDPFWMLILMKNLGSEYIVWDRQVVARFRRPGHGHLHAEFALDQGTLEELLAAADTGERVLRWFSTDLIDDDGQTVATVRREIYLKRRE